MLFGHNTNINVGGITYHVQTEDRGAHHALIDTTVHCRGRVMHRRTNTYSDLLPLDAEREHALRLRLDAQHCAVVDEMRAGTLQLPPPPPEPPKRHASAAERAALEAQSGAPQSALESVTPAAGIAAPVHAPAPQQAPLANAPPSTHLKLELLNAKTWLKGKSASLQILVRDASSHIVSGASVCVRVDGGSGPVEFIGSSDGQGLAQLAFEMPRLVAGEAALQILGSYGSAQGQLRFSLRHKPKIPSQ